VLAVYRDLKRWHEPAPTRAWNWLCGQQNADGGWGGSGGARNSATSPGESSVEETALAVEALLSAATLLPATNDNEGQNPVAACVDRGLEWLCGKVLSNQVRRCSPIGFYFAKLWYYEKLYPLTFTVSALGRAART